MAGFLCELGVEPRYCMTGEKIDAVAAERIKERCAKAGYNEVRILGDSDFKDLEEHYKELTPDLMIGNSKGYRLARKFEIPLFRAGFPIQDRFGGHRRLHLGYSGALAMTDEITNTIISARQEDSPVGYMSM